MAVQPTDDIDFGAKGRRRWDERTSAESVPPEVAWIDAWHVTPPTPEFNHVDEIRYYHPERVALVRSNATLETVLNMDGEQTERSIVLQRAIEQQFAIELDQ